MKMNTKKILLLISIALYCFSGAYASKNDKGIDYYRAELYDAAKLFFQQQTNLTAAEQAENYFYLGQVYAATEKLDLAAEFYKKAIEADPEYPYGYIGEGKLLLDKKTKESISAANSLFKKAIGFAKKDPAVATAVAEAYINMKMYPEAEKALGDARKIKKDYSGIYVAEGDMLMSKGSVGEASGRYETAIRFNPKDKTAYLKYARVYKGINPALSLENLEKLLAVDPEYIPAYAELGDVYYRGVDGKPNYNKAIEAYEKLKDIPGAPLAQEARYAQLLFFTDQFDAASVQIDKVLVKDPDNYVMKRIRAYNNFKLEKYDLGLRQMTEFMQTTKTEDIIALDYAYYGRYLSKGGQPEAAIENLKKSYELDTTRFELLKEISDAYIALRNYPDGIAYSEKYLAENPDPTAIDFYMLGNICYRVAAGMYNASINSEGTTPEQAESDSLQILNYIQIAEKSFTTVKERMPESYMGSYWLGQASVIRDIVSFNGTQGLARPHYEEALPILLEGNGDGKRNGEIVAIYNYLGIYYVQVEDNKITAQEYFEKVLEIDPENAQAKRFLESIKTSK